MYVRYYIITYLPFAYVYLCCAKGQLQLFFLSKIVVAGAAACWWCDDTVDSIIVPWYDRQIDRCALAACCLW